MCRPGDFRSETPDWKWGPSGAGRGVRGGLAAVLVCMLPAVPAEAQSPIPTLSDLGIGYISPGGSLQLSFSGRLDLEAYVPGDDPAWLITSTRPFGTGRLRFFSDLFLGSDWWVTAELRADGGEVPEPRAAEVRMEQLFVRWTPGRLVALQAGRFVSPFGSYPSRHHTAADPLIRPPLPYEYRTMVSSLVIPPNSGAFVQWKRSPGEFRPDGAPPIWGAPYPWGAMISGEARSVDYRLAVLNSAPSSEPEEWGWSAERMKRPSIVAAVGYRLAPWMRVDLFHNRGPYLALAAVGPLAGDDDIWSFDQVLWGGEVLVERGWTVVRGEVFHDRWEVPNVGVDPVDVSWSVEARQRVAPGTFLAARYGAIDFNRIPFNAVEYQGELIEAGVERWDYAARRFQLGAGYRILQNVEVRTEYAWNSTRSPVAPDADLLSIQLWWEF